jgi:signal transduction histidine kinase
MSKLNAICGTDCGIWQDFGKTGASDFRRCLTGILPFSIKLTNEGEISIKLFEKIQDKGDRKKEVLVSITDIGSGLNSEIFGRLFSKFASKSYQGTGLGLFICKSIIQAHGGRIWAENNITGADSSTGATFTFSLPTATMMDRND